MPLSTDQLESLSDAVILLMGVGDDPQVRDQAKSAVYLVTTLARGYTRGKGFGEEESGDLTVAEEIQGVIITASCRLVSNPTQANSESESYPLLRMKNGQPVPGPREGDTAVIATESYAHSGSFTGWTDIERAILHQFRVRAG